MILKCYKRWFGNNYKNTFSAFLAMFHVPLTRNALNVIFCIYTFKLAIFIYVKFFFEGGWELEFDRLSNQKLLKVKTCLFIVLLLIFCTFENS
jgi:hypothetical protein